MTGIGAALGATAAGGVLLAVRYSPPRRPIRLVERMAPYLADTPAPSRLLAAAGTVSAPFEVIRRLFGPTLRGVVGRVDQLLGGATSVRRRLAALGDTSSLEDYRVEQLVWAAGGLFAGGVGTALLGAARGHIDPVLVGFSAVGGVLVGVVARDRALSQKLERRERAMLAEFPVVADLLALAVVAGESPVDAIARVCRLTRGEIARDLESALADARSGTTIVRALTALADRTSLEAFSRFLLGLVVAIERGTPLAEVLRAQAMDVRELGKRTLLEAGGRKEISMMLPVVFMILPVTVLFALYPGLLTLTSLAR